MTWYQQKISNKKILTLYGQPLNFWDDEYLIGKIKFKFLLHGPKWLSKENIDPNFHQRYGFSDWVKRVQPQFLQAIVGAILSAGYWVGVHAGPHGEASQVFSSDPGPKRKCWETRGEFVVYFGATSMYIFCLIF